MITKKKLINYLKNNKGTFLFLLLFFAVRWSFADHTRVPTGSMEPTIAVGDHLFINKIAYDFKIPFTQYKIIKQQDPIPGEIIVFRPPHEPKMLYVKRLIAQPGDYVEIHDGFIRINGRNLKIDNSINITNPIFHYQENLNGHVYTVNRDLSLLRSHDLKFTVPANKYFFVGDNRDNSLDSRSWGFVDRSALVGKATTVLFSVKLQNYLPAFKLNRTFKELI